MLVYHVSMLRVYTCRDVVLLCGVCGEGVEYTRLLQALKQLLGVTRKPRRMGCVACFPAGLLFVFSGRSRGLLLAVEVIVGVFRAAAMAARASDLFSEVAFSRKSLPITLPPLLFVVFFS